MNMKNFLIILCLIILTTVLFKISTSKAEFIIADHLVINEVYPNPLPEGTTEQTNEWIELYNPTNQLINLSNCSIEDKAGNSVLLTSYSQIESKEYALVYNSKLTYWLNNDEDGLSLKEGDLEVDSVAYGAAGIAAKPPQGKSISRYPNGIDTDNNSNDFKISKPSPEEARYSYSDSVKLSELFPHPTAGSPYQKAFIELYYSGADAIDISQWSFSDKSNKVYPILNGQLSAEKRYLALEFDNLLNKASDEVVYLLDPNGDLKDGTNEYSAYGVAHSEGMSFSYINGQWVWTSHLTPNLPNVADEIGGGSGPLNIIDIDNIDNGQEVEISGIVTAPPGSISQYYFYIEDSTGGIQIYFYKGLFPNLKSGDLIKVRGILSSVSGEKRVKISDPGQIIILSNELMPNPKEEKINEINDTKVGNYVTISGKISKTSGSTFYVIDSSGQEIQVIVKNTKLVKLPKKSKNDLITVFGIISKYNNKYRLLPFRTEDVKLIAQKEGLPEAGPNLKFIILIALCSQLIAIKKLRNLPKNWLQNFRPVRSWL